MAARRGWRPNRPRTMFDRENLKADKAVADYAEAGREVLPIWQGIKCVAVIETELLKPDRVHGGIVQYFARVNEHGDPVLCSHGANDDAVVSKAVNKRAGRISRDFRHR